MKRKTIILIAIFVAILLGVLVTSSFTSKYNQVVFLMRHSSLYLLIAITVLLLMIIAYKKTIKRVEKQTHISIIKIATIFIFMGLLYLGSIIQMSYIQKYDSPILSTCSYYDEYGNLLYYNHLPMSCEEPDVTIDGNKKTLNFIEHYEGQFEQFWVYDGYYTFEDREFSDGYIIIDLFVEVVTIHTDDKLTYYSLKWTEFAAITVDEETEYAVISRQKVVENTYLSKTFISDQKIYDFQDMEYTLYSIGMGHHWIDENESLLTSHIQYKFDYNEPFGSSDIFKEFKITKIDVINFPDSEDTIASGIRKYDEGEFTQISRAGEVGDLSTMRYVFNELDAVHILAVNHGGLMIFDSDIVKNYGYEDNSLIINSFNTKAESFNVFVYNSVNNESISIEVPRFKSYQKIFETSYGFVQKNYVDGVSISEYRDSLLNYGFSDMSYYYYDQHIGFLDYEELIFESWPTYFAVDQYRAIFDFE